MNVIITGPRHIQGSPAHRYVKQAIDESDFRISRVLTGGEKGIEDAAETWANRNRVLISVFPVDWNKFAGAKKKNPAGAIRNMHMLAQAEAMIAVWNGHDRATQFLIDAAEEGGLDVFVYDIE